MLFLPQEKEEVGGLGRQAKPAMKLGMTAQANSDLPSSPIETRASMVNG